jgi:hypothetical protein
MKKILLLLLTASQIVKPYLIKALKLQGGIATENTAIKVVVQSANNVLNTISSDLVNVEPYASAVNLPVTGYQVILLTMITRYTDGMVQYTNLSITGTGQQTFTKVYRYNCFR